MRKIVFINLFLFSIFISIAQRTNPTIREESKVPKYILPELLKSDTGKKINNQIQNPAQYSQIKKSIARLYTTLKNSK